MTQSLPKPRGNRPGVVAALFAILLFIAGCGGSTKTATPAPTFTPVAGSYSATQYVTVADTNQKAVLHCTNDGSTPTASSVQCANPITVSQSQTLRAIAIVSGMEPSDVVSAAFTITASAAVPTVTSIGPVNGPASGGTSVTIVGTSFTGATAVSFGTVAAASFTVNSATSITAISPAGTGTAHVTVVTPTGGRSATSTADIFAYDVVPTPTVTGIVPSSGLAAGGASVSITGNNFTGTTAVYFGTIAATSFTVNSTTSITAVAPAGSGTADVKVVTSGGASATSAADEFTYISSPTITGVSPSAGPAAGGTIVTISGTGFSGATAVNFGAAAATSFTVDSDTSITAVSPAGSSAVDVKVLAPGGVSTTSAADEFTYIVAAPEVTTISPSSGPSSGGTSVTITGTGFSGATEVDFGATAATGFTIGSSKSITATSPAGSGTVHVKVLSSGGESDTSTADEFTYVPPTISGTVLSGPASSGTAIKNASVYLYAAGITGYGTRSADSSEIGYADTDSTGAFSITYDCSTLSAPGDQLYLEAFKGQRVVLMAALGSCSSITSSYPNGVTINEATTIASAYALSAFASIDSSIGGIDIGAPATYDATNAPKCNEQNNWQSTGEATCNYIGLKSAFATVSNLVNISTGQALNITPSYTASDNVSKYNMSIVPQARINALANVLAACANPTTGLIANCTTLFADATVSTSVLIDTLQAALNIALHPSNNASTIATALAAANTTIFTPTLTSTQTSALTDWTLPIIFKGAGLGTASGYYPVVTGMAIDGEGNIWVPAATNGNLDGNSYSTSTGGLVAVFNNLGAPISTSGTSASLGGYTAGGIQNPTSIAIDKNNDAWIGNYATPTNTTQGSVTVLDKTGAALYGTASTAYTNHVMLIPHPYGIAVDVSNNVWVSSNTDNCTAVSGATKGGSILELTGSGSAITSGAASDNFSDNSSCPEGIAIDNSGILWANDRGSGTMAKAAYGGNGGALLFNTSDGSLSGGAYRYGIPACDVCNISIDSSGNGWFASSYNTVAGVSNSYQRGVTKLPTFAGVTTVNELGANATITPTFYNPLNLTYSSTLGANPRFMVLDGGGQAWFSNSTKSTGLFAFSTNTGTLISPSSGYTGYNGDGYYPLYFGLVPAALAVDSSGNVWVAGSSLQTGGSVEGSQLTEFVGLGVPAPTPLVSGLVGNTLGKRP